MHVQLHAGNSEHGQPALEPVHVAPLGGNRFRVLFSPGVVYGVAAGDEIVRGEDGRFEVVHRGRNIAVRVLSEHPLQPHVPRLLAEVEQLGGTLDGQVDRGLAFTIPAAAGFAAVERVFEAFVTEHSGSLWEYGNVYGESGEPLGWWERET